MKTSKCALREAGPGPPRILTSSSVSESGQKVPRSKLRKHRQRAPRCNYSFDPFAFTAKVQRCLAVLAKGDAL
jgi:hypothetical protein